MEQAERQTAMEAVAQEEEPRRLEHISKVLEVKVVQEVMEPEFNNWEEMEEEQEALLEHQTVQALLAMQQ